MSVILDRDGADLARTRRRGLRRFEAAVRREITRRGGVRPCLRIVRLLSTALTDPAGVLTHRPVSELGPVTEDFNYDAFPDKGIVPAEPSAEYSGP